MSNVKYLLYLTVLLIVMGQKVTASSEVIPIGSRRELFVDDFLIEQIENLTLKLHEPTRQELVWSVDAPWENSNVSSYCSVVQDGERYLLYYRAGARAGTSSTPDTGGAYILCVAESADGISWSRPELSICAEGPNVILNDAFCREYIASDASLMPAVTTVILDQNPACPPDEKFKMLIANMAGASEQKRFYLLTSADGFHFVPRNVKDVPFEVLTTGDSQNTIVFDSEAGLYRIYHRTWDGALRTISTTASSDLLHFSPNQPIQFNDDKKISLYTNGIVYYPRAPQILLGFPVRYDDFGETWDMGVLNRPGLEHRANRAKMGVRYGTVATDLLFMSSRDGVNFHRFRESFVRPGPERKNSWVYGDNEFVHGLVTTKSKLGNDAPDELSFYTVSGYWEDDVVSFRRHSLRQDGFVSLHAGADTGTVLTKPLLFSGGRLSLNAATSAGGRIRVGFTDINAIPIAGFTLEECYPIAGDSLDLTVRWKNGGSDLQALEGKEVRMQISMSDADLYSFCFAAGETDPQLPAIE